MSENARNSSIMAWAGVNDLRDITTERLTLQRAAQRPIPILPIDPIEREAVLTFLVLRERDYFHRTMQLLEKLCEPC